MYHPTKTIFDKIEEEGIAVIPERKYSQYRATFDIEVYYPRDGENLPDKREKLEFTAQRELLSISLASNVPEYQTPRCFVVEQDEKDTVKQFIQYLHDIASKANELELARCGDLLRTLEEMLCSPSQASQATHAEKEEKMGESTGYDHDGSESESEEEVSDSDLEFIDDSDEEEEMDLSWYRRVDQAREEREGFGEMGGDDNPSANLPLRRRKNHRLLSELREHIGEFMVVGFNSGKYDLNVLKDILIPHLVHTEGVQFTVKRGQAYLLLKSGSLKFVDVTNFLAPGTTYAGFLKAYGCEEQKGFFPYEWVDSLEKLQETQLLPREAFSSWLKKTELSEEEYMTCQEAWRREGMRTMRDCLVWYNNLDVGPFVEALEKMCQFWQSKGIDMLKEAISLPGLAFKFEMGFLRNQGVHLSSFHTEDLYKLFKENMVGGPAIIFNRYAEVGKTHIRNNPEKPVRKIVGYDANALYLWALCQPMPVGLYTHWHLSHHYLVPNKSWRTADEWLAWVAHQQSVELRHRLNDTEKRLGDCQLPVDGFDTASNTVYEYMGCYWHGCPSCFNPENVNRSTGKTYGELFEETNLRTKYLESLPNVSQVVQCWECEWLVEKRGPEAPSIETFLNEHFPGRNEQRHHSSSILDRVRDGTFFGALEVDIHVPDTLQPKFAEMTPIFKNTEIKLDDIGDHMKEFA